MADEITGDAPDIGKLNEQIENLNKGIAKYRDDATTAGKVSESAKKEAAEAKAEVERLRKVIEEATEDKDDKPAPKLSDDDEKRLAAWAKQNGFVTKVEMDAERQRMLQSQVINIENQAVSEFLASHPEYDDDEEFAKIKKEFEQYRVPTSITGYRQLLNKIHKELKGKDNAAAEARAESENRKRLGLGGGSQGGSATDTTLEDLMEKYPNLSREQVEGRIEEINQLAKVREAKAKAKQRR